MRDLEGLSNSDRKVISAYRESANPTSTLVGNHHVCRGCADIDIHSSAFSRGKIVVKRHGVKQGHWTERQDFWTQSNIAV